MRHRLGILSMGTIWLACGCGEGPRAGLDGPALTRPAILPGPAFTEIYQTVLSPHGCVNSYCHPVEGMDAAYTHFLDGSATTVACNGARRVVPGAPEESLLYLKVSLDPPPCGVRMPYGFGSLPAEEVDLIGAWIAGGALP